MRIYKRMSEVQVSVNGVANVQRSTAWFSIVRWPNSNNCAVTYFQLTKCYFPNWEDHGQRHSWPRDGIQCVVAYMEAIMGNDEIVPRCVEQQRKFAEISTDCALCG